MKDCPKCGRKVEDFKEECPVCGYGFDSKETKKESHTYKPKVAGYLMIVSAVSGIVFALLILLGYWDVQSMLASSQDVLGEEFKVSKGLFGMILKVCSVVLLFFSSIQLTGAVFSFKREKWDIALLGAFVGVFLIGIFFLSTVLSVIALILFLSSKDEFI